MIRSDQVLSEVDTASCEAASGEFSCYIWDQEQAKALAARDVFRPAMAIVEDVVRRIIPEEEMFLAPKMDLLKRASNLHRSKVRPTEPSDINFELGLDFIKSEEFLVKDIHGDGCRHILFATKYQLSLLCETRIWYMDGTFKIVPDFLKPRGQLMSLHGFVRRDGREQQFPLLFASSMPSWQLYQAGQWSRGLWWTSSSVPGMPSP
uniref:Uncharacterized protein LOC111131622 n=1 Tax=Crassostrea virginica TaxID=6565 RepID=A0A8B8E5I4_CRAVI|nr:uncharacterized protein LOC111131622 [Crassostrea virginica]